MNWREAIPVLLLACCCFGILWYYGDKEFVCKPQGFAGTYRVGDICRVKR